MTAGRAVLGVLGIIVTVALNLTLWGAVGLLALAVAVWVGRGLIALLGG